MSINAVGQAILNHVFHHDKALKVLPEHYKKELARNI
jgi:hypothetical protein